jgi:hypothetical protein
VGREVSMFRNIKFVHGRPPVVGVERYATRDEAVKAGESWIKLSGLQNTVTVVEEVYEIAVELNYKLTTPKDVNVDQLEKN